jgi:hypothetical protein
MDDQISVTIKQVPRKLWKTIKLAAVASDKGISQFVLELLQKAMNGRAK